MYYTYVLESQYDKTFYYGSSDDPITRLNQKHNKGKVIYTRSRMPWKLIYQEEFATRREAMCREKFFKSGKGREYLKSLLK
jgi:putative endonuclease